MKIRIQDSGNSWMPPIFYIHLCRFTPISEEGKQNHPLQQLALLLWHRLFCPFPICLVYILLFTSVNIFQSYIYHIESLGYISHRLEVTIMICPYVRWESSQHTC